MTKWQLSENRVCSDFQLNLQKTGKNPFNLSEIFFGINVLFPECP